MTDSCNTTTMDGAPCDRCGDDAVWAPTILEGSRLSDVSLCGACTDDLTTLCPDCQHRIWQADGLRITGSPDLHCRDCAKRDANLTAEFIRESRRDEMNDSRR